MSKQVAIVTGGAQGIGLGLTRALLNAGYAVAMFDLNSEAMDKLVAEAGAQAQNLMGVKVDVTSAEQVNAAVAQVAARWKAPDLLVNNAGLTRDKRLVNMSEADWDLVLDVNLKSQFLCAKAVVPGMIEQGFGRIVNISSRAWLGGFGQANYSAAKGGVISLTRTLAIELAKHGITANAIAPGAIDTPILAPLSDEQRAKIMATIPVGRIGKPEDIAHAVLMFADPKASYITGQTLYVCGGRSLSSPSA
ncbi:3-oxoacyl-ACP reductase FabG [Pseudomonas nitroreducens]|uniref:2,3-dihydroxy-2,3-dihydro-p-cumate dehydrogenase n=2 Tax=Pseudomonas nitroreducens TaxID=46680 RepID=A0A6G6IX36_PSENT|nr:MULTISPECIES: 3-oxoacyl-ACP reductase FabG [Pseudomonas]MDG9857723.1 3-oxoacyl-ACP reductase FabG [Pseudomonas nitroreducens]MDH1076293.1 3-oxoacyl-ACP reductase FabG [Pseudomonas nitroreducens]NMZ73666.1 3-oxoacyl-ACP reductase FabG [Pseudomonas nitroreducens]QIE87517.1 SDR family oxidoreductase [Pseudomonas nitroreducens]UCL89791.1 3-oxoacyl-ACP reductase FabG [Pseudomonas sp. HS-18]